MRETKGRNGRLHFIFGFFLRINLFLIEQETKSILESQIAEERKLVTQLKESHMHLEEKLRTKEAEISHRSKEISQEVEQGRRSLGELTQEYQKLRLELVSSSIHFLHLVINSFTFSGN